MLEFLLSQTTFNTHSRRKWWERLALNCDYHLKDKTKASLPLLDLDGGRWRGGKGEEGRR